MSRKPSKKSEVIHIRLARNGDGIVNKEYLCKIADKLSKDEGEDINISEVVRRAIGIIIPAMGKNLNMLQVSDIIISDGDIANALRKIKLSDILNDIDRKEIKNPSLLDLYKVSLNNGMREAFEGYKFNKLLIEIYKKALIEEEQKCIT